MNVFAIGASRNIGYYSAIRLLEKGATVTFLLRSPSVFDGDEVVQRYVKSGHARLVQGDALKPETVARGWQVAQEGPSQHVDVLLYTLGGTPKIHLLKGAVITPPDLCTRTLLNVLRTMPPSHRPVEAQPKIIAISSTGVTKSSRSRLPPAMKLLCSVLLGPAHADKLGMERILAHCEGWNWQDREPRGDILSADWKTVPNTPEEGGLKNVLVIRAAMLTDGDCKGDVQSSPGSKAPYRAGEGDLDDNGYTISRKDVAHFVVEGALKDWERWGGKVATVAY